MKTSDKERPCGIQISGDEPSTMAQAALSAMKNNPDIIDINMGCPARITPISSTLIWVVRLRKSAEAEAAAP